MSEPHLAGGRSPSEAGERGEPGGSGAPIVLAANARLVSQRANSLQIASAAAAFARAGRATTLVHALRRGPGGVREAPVDPWTHYALPDGPRPRIVGVRSVDWVDRVPGRLQYLPARVQELDFARRAARLVAREHGDALVLTRELEIARHLARRRHPRLFLEVHRVPGGRLRRRWLVEAAAGCAGVVAISGGVAADLAELGVGDAAGPGPRAEDAAGPGHRRGDAVRRELRRGDAAGLAELGRGGAEAGSAARPQESAWTAAPFVLVEHDAFEPARFAARPERAAARAALALPPEATVVAYTGGLLAWKGVDVLVEAARALPGLVFVIAGGMEADVTALRARAAGLANVRVEGFQPPERVPLYLAACDLAVVPNRARPAISARYTSPLKVFEAMAAGVPLVASDLPSLRELLTHEEDALLVAPDDPVALAAGIARLAGDAALRAGLGSRLAARAALHTYDARAARLVAWMERRVAARIGKTRLGAAPSAKDIARGGR